MIRDRFEIIINAIKTGVPLSNPRNRFEEVINAIVGSSSSITPLLTRGYPIANLNDDEVLYSPDITVQTSYNTLWTGEVATNGTFELTLPFSYEFLMFGIINDANRGRRMGVVTSVEVESGKFTVGFADAWATFTYDTDTRICTMIGASNATVKLVYVKKFSNAITYPPQE